MFVINDYIKLTYHVLFLYVKKKVLYKLYLSLENRNITLNSLNNISS